MFDYFMLTPAEIAEAWFVVKACGVIAVLAVITHIGERIIVRMGK